MAPTSDPVRPPPTAEALRADLQRTRKALTRVESEGGFHADSSESKDPEDPTLLHQHHMHTLSLAILALPFVNSSTPQDDQGAAPSSVTTSDEEQRLQELRAELLELLEIEDFPAAATATTGGSPVVDIGSGGFRVKSANGESSIRIGGRMHADANTHGNEGSLDSMIDDGTELRRARFELKGTLPENLSWAAEVDLADNRTSIKDFWIGYETSAGPRIFAGHQKQPYSLDIEMSSNDIPFVERGIDYFLLVPFVDRAIGARVQDNTESFFYAAGIYGEDVSNNPVDDEGWGLAGRAVYAPVQSDDQVVHLGARAAYRMPDEGSDSIQIKNETTNMSNFAVVDTGMLMNVDSVFVYGPEAVWARGLLARRRVQPDGRRHVILDPNCPAVTSSQPANRPVTHLLSR